MRATSEQSECAQDARDVAGHSCARPASERQLGEILDGTYRLEKLLSAKQFGTGYIARHVRLGRKVLVQLAPGADALADFLDEMELQARLMHPNILQVLDSRRDSALGPYQVLEYLEGQTLDDTLKEQGCLTTDEAVTTCLQLSSALEALHQEGRVHGALKPSKILLSRQGSTLTAKLTGVGQHQHTGKRYPASSELDVMGTLLYSAPEQTSSESVCADPGIDQFALAVIAYEMLVGDVPFVAHCPASYVTEVRRGLDLDVCRALSDDAIAVLAKALNWQPELRHSRMMSFALRLSAAIGTVRSGHSTVRALAVNPVSGVSSSRLSVATMRRAETVASRSILDLMLQSPEGLSEAAVRCNLGLAPGHSAASATSPDEAFLLSRLERSAPLGEVLEISSMPHEHALELLAGLVQRGVVKLSA